MQPVRELAQNAVKGFTLLGGKVGHHFLMEGSPHLQHTPVQLQARLCQKDNGCTPILRIAEARGKAARLERRDGTTDFGAIRPGGLGDLPDCRTSDRATKPGQNAPFRIGAIGPLGQLSQGSAIHQLAQQVQPERWIVQAGHHPTVDVPRIAGGCRPRRFVGPFPDCQSECSNNYDGS